MRIPAISPAGDVYKFQLWKLRTENFHDRAQRPLEKASIFWKTTRVTREGSLEPCDLNLCIGYLAELKLAVYICPILAVWDSNLCCRRSFPSTVNHHQAGVLARVSIGQLDELRKLVGCIRHADGDHGDFSRGRRLAVSV